MLESTPATYGAPYSDAKPVKNPTTQLAASKGNRFLDDVAQMTRTSVRAEVNFKPVASGNPTVDWHFSVWGGGDAQKPTITRTATGRYTITYATTLVDGYGTSETLAFRSGQAGLITANNDSVHFESISANVVKLYLRDAAAALSDLTATETIMVWLR